MDDPGNGKLQDQNEVQLLVYQRAPLAGLDEDDQPPPTPPPPLPPPSAPIGPPPPRPAEGPKVQTATQRDEESAKFMEDCSRPRPTKGTAHLLSSLYAKMMLSAVFVLLLTEILPNGRPLLFFHGYLFSWVLGAGLLCLLCIYVGVIAQRCPGMEEIHEMEVTAPTYRSLLPQISVFFRVGFFVFGLGTLIGVGLGAATLFTLEQPCVDQINWLQPLLLAAFTLLQTHVLCLNSQRSIGCLGWCRHPVLMHLCAANLALWLRMFIWDGAEMWLKHTHTFDPNPTAHTFKNGHHSIHVSSDCTWQVQTPDVVEDLLRLRNCYRNSTLGVIWAEARPFIKPFVFQYCIAAAVLQYALWKIPPPKSHSQSFHQVQPQQRMDCRGSSKGLFLGLLVLAVGIVALILYFVLAHNPGLKQETVLVLVCTHSGLLLLALLASLFGFCRVAGMCTRTNRDSCATLHQILQTIGICALFVQSGCTLVAASQDGNLASMSSQSALSILSQGGSVLIAMTDAILCIVHALIQSILFHRLGQKQCSSECPHENSRPGRQVITFLAFCNLVLWVTDTFAGGRDQAVSQLQLQSFGILPWKLITQLTVPLVMLYRFQSTVYLFEAWHFGFGGISK
ncbi:proton channel OtopLc-like [Argiope bruennichi]|uniref:proton channel OtopLc-like n=1 Tax=Argiope bruennichi TaxID=94029 RepID=UPI002494A333|nr:proton channel OtopLc-like [Argiope bruennichi]